MSQPQVPVGVQSPPPQEGSVAVMLRVRPPNPRERAAPRVLRILDQQHVVLLGAEEPGGASPARSPGRRRQNLEFVFDHVFDEGATQEEVFQHTTLPLLNTLLAGYNCSVFAYGASGVGKTYTMMGSKTSPGMVHLATVELYKRLEDMKDKSCEVLVSYQQVYKERVYDLLECRGPLNVCEQPGKGAVVQGLSFHQATSAQQLLHMLAKGNKNRAQRHTQANATSSRSHAIFQIQVKQWDTAGSPAGDPRLAKLSFIDLAGSERASDTPGLGEGLWEGTSINRSLLALKSVVHALAGAKGGQSHVPFRNSKLTLLLKDSLGGSCRSTLIAAVSPAAPAGPGTCSTLQFASRARHILLPARTPSPFLQDLSGHQEQNLCPDGMTVKTKEAEVLPLEKNTGLEEAAPPCSAAEPSQAAPAPGMRLSCVAKAPVTMPGPSVPSTDSECSLEFSPCSSPTPMSPGPVKRMLEWNTDSKSAQSPAVFPGPRRVSAEPSPPAGTQSSGTPAPAAAETPSPLPGPAPALLPPSAEQQQPELRAALPHPPPSTSPSFQTPNTCSSSPPSSSCSLSSIPSCLPPPSCPPTPFWPPVPFWPWFQLCARVCAPSVGSVLFVCLQVVGGFRK